EPAFPGAKRVVGGISGIAIKNHALETVRRLKTLAAKKPELAILGVGGISSAADVKLFLEAGADVVQMCKAALHNPYIGKEISKQLFEASNQTSPRRSKVLDETGLTIPFRDSDTAKTLDLFLRTCHRTSTPFEVAIDVFQEKWLKHITNIDTVNQRSEPPQK